MKALLFYAFSLLSIIGMSQNCKYEKNEIDPFTRKSVKEVFIIIDAKVYPYVENVAFYILKDDSAYSLRAEYVYPLMKNQYEATPADKLYIALADGSSIELPILSPGNSVEFAQSGPTKMMRITSFYSINEAQILALSKTLATKIRFTFTSLSVDKDISTKRQKQLMQSAACILK